MMPSSEVILLRRYNGIVAESVKVDADAFKAALRALLNTPITPADKITDKRQRNPEAKKPWPKKRPMPGPKKRPVKV